MISKFRNHNIPEFFSCHKNRLQNQCSSITIFQPLRIPPVLSGSQLVVARSVHLNVLLSNPNRTKFDLVSSKAEDTRLVRFSENPKLFVNVTLAFEKSGMSCLGRVDLIS